MAKYELIGAGISKAKAVLPAISAKHRNDRKKFLEICTPEGAGHNSSVESFLNKLNQVKSFDDIPEVVNISYANLIIRNLDFKQTADLIKLTANLAASRFGKKPKELVLTGFAATNISESTQQQLISAGFQGCNLSPIVSGFEAATDAHFSWQKDNSYWSPGLTPGNVIVPCHDPLKIELTFRQSQIAKMIFEKGLTNHQIARQLSLSDSTVKMHIGVILKKYGVQSRTQLIALNKDLAI